MNPIKPLKILSFCARRASRCGCPKRFLLKMLYLGVFLWITLAGPVQASNKADELQQRLADISLLHGQLQERIKSAVDLREKLYGEIKQLRSEVLSLKKENQVRNFSQAIDIPRIRYNLTLIRELKGYIANFNDKIRLLQIGADKLYYLYHQAEDDLRIIHTLNDLKIDALLSQIDGVMDEYLPEAHNLLVDLNCIPYEKPERIWEQMVNSQI